MKHLSSLEMLANTNAVIDMCILFMLVNNQNITGVFFNSISFVVIFKTISNFHSIFLAPCKICSRGLNFVGYYASNPKM